MEGSRRKESGVEKKWEEMIRKEEEGELKERGKRWKEAGIGKVG
jgi:hypothetical protein